MRISDWSSDVCSSDLGGVPCAGIVKADGYGLGADRVAPALWEAGCRVFFVATLDEAVRLRPVVPDARLCCLHGLLPGTEAVFAGHCIVPVRNTLEQDRKGAVSGKSVSGRVDLGGL